MPRFEPIDATRCKNHGWRRLSSFEFASGDSLAPLVVDEIPYAMAMVPIAFHRPPGGKRFELAAVQSLEQKHNLLVHPETGNWTGGYIPAVYRGYPFSSLPEKGTGRSLLCFDMESGLYRENPGPEDTPFFGPDGQMSPTLAEVARFLQRYENQRRITMALTDLLAGQDLIVYWEIRVNLDSDNQQSVEGLYRVDEKRIKDLPSDVLDELVKSEALPLAYAQLFSQHRLPNIEKIYNVQTRSTQKPRDVDLEKLFGEEDVFRFDG